jgi:hypothetical protein
VVVTGLGSLAGGISTEIATLNAKIAALIG